MDLKDIYIQLLNTQLHHNQACCQTKPLHFGFLKHKSVALCTAWWSHFHPRYCFNGNARWWLLRWHPVGQLQRGLAMNDLDLIPPQLNESLTLKPPAFTNWIVQLQAHLTNRQAGGQVPERGEGKGRECSVRNVRSQKTTKLDGLKRKSSRDSWQIWIDCRKKKQHPAIKQK